MEKLTETPAPFVGEGRGGGTFVTTITPIPAFPHRGGRGFFFVLLVLLSSGLRAETPSDIFKRANALYAEGKFTEAQTVYEEAEKTGLRHWALAYNLGNSYFKTGQLGKAVAAYHRAFRLNPTSRDIIFNLRLASEKAGDPVVPQSALPALLWRLFYGLSINTLTLGVSLLFVGLSVLGGILWRAPAASRLRQPAAILVPGLGGVLFLLGVWLAARIYFLEKPLGVVIQSPAAEVRSGPNTSYPASFTVPEGRRVLILKEQDPIDGWLEIGVPSEGLKGWVQDSSVATL